MDNKLQNENNLFELPKSSIIINIPTTLIPTTAIPKTIVATTTTINKNTPTTFSITSPLPSLSPSPSPSPSPSSSPSSSPSQTSFSSSYDTDSSVNSTSCCSMQHDYRIYMERPVDQATGNNSDNSNNALRKPNDIEGGNCIAKKQDQYHYWPIFILLISFIEVSVFVYDVVTVPGETFASPLTLNDNLVLSSPSSSFSSSSVAVASTAGSSSKTQNGMRTFQNLPLAISTDSIFIYRPDRRLEVWRFISYMFLHANWFHLGFNVVIQLFYGVPLEIMHGSLRIAVIYFAGVFAGSLGTSVVDSEVYLVGASSGVYALLAAHLANIALNYQQMKFAIAQLISVIIFVLCDLGYAFYTQYMIIDDGLNNDNTTPAVSYIAHLTGALAGLSIGLLVLKSVQRRPYDNLIWWAALSTYCAFTVFAIVFNLINTITAQLLEEQGEVITQHLLQELGVS